MESVPANDPLIVNSLKVVDAVLKVDTPFGPCWRRYNHDGYGQREDGGPYLGWGKGRAWPLLTGERGHYELAAGHDVKPYLNAIEKFASSTGLLPEQIWDEQDMKKRTSLFRRTHRLSHASDVGSCRIRQVTSFRLRRQNL